MLSHFWFFKGVVEIVRLSVFCFKKVKKKSIRSGYGLNIENEIQGGPKKHGPL